MNTMQTLWQEITAWFKDYAKPCYDNIMCVPCGADETQLAELEAVLGKTLPEDFKDYLRLYNKSYRVVFFEYESLDIRLMLRRWESLNLLLDEGLFDSAELFHEAKKIRRAKWCHGWLPFAQDGCGNLICLDLDPSQDGVFGQVFYWETRGGPGTPEADSFLEFVTDYRDALLSGHYTYDATSGTFKD